MQIEREAITLLKYLEIGRPIKTTEKKFQQLTDAELKCETGKENELLNNAAIRENKNREEVINIFKKGQPT